VPSEPDLWRCETCGQTFVGRNMPHSCRVVDLDSHFEAAPALRPVFDAYLRAAELNGPVTVNATKSRITFQVRMRLAAVEPAAHALRRRRRGPLLALRGLRRR
jgi:hypothetical protein